MKPLHEIEKILQASLPVCTVQEISSLNDFQDYSHIIQLYQRKILRFNFRFQENIVDNYGSWSQIILEKILFLSPIVMIILSIVLAIIKSQYILLIGIPLTILGILLTTPRIMKQGKSFTGTIMLLTLILGICLTPFNFVWGFFLLCYGISNFLITVNRELNIIVFEEAIFRSELIFIYYFLRNEFQFINVETQKIYKIK
jgi:hypothetical protein